MAIELSWLVGCVGIFFLHILSEVFTGNRQYSLGTLLGPRDQLEPLGAPIARCKRATANMIESLVMFAPLVLVAVVAGKTNEMTALGAMIFFFARLAYAPLYWFGVPVARTLAWFAGLGGILLIFFQVIPFSGAA